MALCADPRAKIADLVPADAQRVLGASGIVGRDAQRTSLSGMRCGAQRDLRQRIVPASAMRGGDVALVAATLESIDIHTPTIPAHRVDRMRRRSNSLRLADE